MLVKLQRGEEVGEGGGEEGSVGTSMEERMAGLNLGELYIKLYIVTQCYHTTNLSIAIIILGAAAHQ